MGMILVIEDAQDNFDLVEDALDGAHDVVHAEDGQAGLALARERRPGLVLLDMGLPGMDGWEVVRHLKADRETAEIPVVAVTAHAMSGDREKCLKAGCDAYLAKPVDVQELLALVERLMLASAVHVPASQDRS
jgi:CheY-like chemotaxis protein